MHIVLFALNGSFSHSALSVRCLAHALREAGYSPAILEGNLRDRSRALLARLVAQNADVYGFSCYIWNIEEMLSLAENLKALLPDCRILLGGPEVSYDSERFTALPFVDCVASGEGEHAVVDAVRAWQSGKAPSRLLFGKPYGSFLQQGVQYGENEPVPPLVYYESSRGCPFSCSFCLSSASDGVRAKSVGQTLSELLEFEKHPERLTVKLVDRTFNFDRARANAIWQGLLSPRYTKCYHFEIAAQLLDEESFEILSKFPQGKVRLEIGLQSTNEKTLAAVQRHTDAEAVLAAARRLTAQNACHVHLDLIAGLPHEDLSSLAHAFDAAYNACHVLQLGFLKFLHGTAIRESAASFGAIFEQKAPYTVLKTDRLSFAEISKLHAVSDLMERMRDSGRFVHSLYFLLARLPSPFAFYCDFDEYLKNTAGREIQKISGRDLFWHLSQFAKDILPEREHDALSAHLRADFAAAEVRRPPKGL